MTMTLSPEKWVKIERLLQYVASDTASKARALAELREILEEPEVEVKKEEVTSKA
jgi:hypothetical protein